MSSVLIVQQVLHGLLDGVYYLLIALGLSLIFSLGGIVIWLSEHHGDAIPGSHIVFKVRGLAAWHGEISAKNYMNARPGIGPHIGGGTCVSVGDPSGNTLEFVEDRTG